ncbi:TIGR01777 family protein [Anoxybacillus sediminis]|nr:TIGR01777 family protein [Anoxybacillus sediminis]
MGCGHISPRKGGRVKKKIILAGGSGFLGQSLAALLTQKGYDVVILTRGASTERNHVRYVHWDGATIDTWTDEIDGSHAVINLTGKSVNCIYTKKNRDEIIRSRLDSVNVLADTILTCKHPPKVFVQAGSLAIFGDTRNLCDEDAPHGTGFSADVCKQWETAFFSRKLPSTRQVLLRIGFVLGRDGGALEPMIKLTRYNLGGTIGKGNQYISWLHIDDMNQIFLAAVEDDRMTGIYNATGPHPVTNKEFMAVLRKVLNKGWAPPTPAPLVWLGAYVFMRTEPSLALTGRNCVPKRLADHGFRFRHPDLEAALFDLLGKP